MSHSSNRTLVLARHGEVRADWRRRIYGRLNVPLSEGGVEEMRQLGLRYRDWTFERVVSSGLARAECGAAFLREGRRLERIDDSELREIDRGVWAGKTYEEIDAVEPGAFARWTAAPQHLRPAGGESLAMMRTRVVRALDRHLTETWGDLAIVAHSWVLRTTLCHVAGIPLDRAPSLMLATGRAIEIELPGGKPLSASRRRSPQIVGWCRD